MKLQEFTIGEEFWLGGKRWRCTDIGSRVIVGIQMGELQTNVEKLTYEQALDDGWFDGPPYAVLEHVLDENDIVVCTVGNLPQEQPGEPAFGEHIKEAAATIKKLFE